MANWTGYISKIAKSMALLRKKVFLPRAMNLVDAVEVDGICDYKTLNP